MVNSHGGKREGAGRPSLGRKKVSFYITDEEKQKIIDLLFKLRMEDGTYTERLKIQTYKENGGKSNGQETE